jgi:CRP-like cAMP-binding protein
VSISPDELSALPLFEGASSRAIAALAKRAVEVSYAPGVVLFLAGNQPRGWYIVLDGCVRVVRGQGTRQHVIHTEGRGGTLGEVPMFGGETHPATGIAAEPTRCAIFDKPSLESAIAECPEIGFLINRRLALRVKRLVERLDERSRSVRCRLAEFLLDRHAQSKTSDRISIGMTQQSLAEELGTVREVAARELKFIVADDVIAPLGGGRYEVLDADTLRQIASGS